MDVITIDELTRQEFSITDVDVIPRRPSFRRLESKSRQRGGFVYVLNGLCEFSYGNGETISASSGGVVYLPKGSNHVFSIRSEDFSMILFYFRLKVNGTVIQLSDHPILICERAPIKFVEISKSMLQRKDFEKNTLSDTIEMCMLFQSLLAEKKTDTGILRPALNFIAEHLTENIPISVLAKLCFLGRSRFYSLFKEKIGMSPLTYMDKLKTDQAKRLLSSDGSTVTEVAQALGFESPAYFSRWFKKNTGIAPIAFLQKQK